MARPGAPPVLVMKKTFFLIGFVADERFGAAIQQPRTTFILNGSQQTIAEIMPLQFNASMRTLATESRQTRWLPRQDVSTGVSVAAPEDNPFH